MIINPDNRLSCRLDGLIGLERERKRLQVLAELGLLEAESVPIFEEATQTVAHFLEVPICLVGIIDRDRQIFKSAVGLSRTGLMNDLASSRQIPRQESFCTHVVDSQQTLVLHHASAHPAFANSLLVQRYGIQAYLGVPLILSTGYCMGTLAIMEPSPRDFNHKEVEFLELTARWICSEFERNRFIKSQQILQMNGYLPAIPADNNLSNTPNNVASGTSLRSVKTELITQMTQELRTPLTSILGMASVLNGEIYGALTEKQKKYINVIYTSGQYLLTLVNEILDLGGLNDHNHYLDLSPVDIEMLCQQAINILSRAADRRKQTIKLTIEPSQRIWLLDKEKVRQMLYHLVFNVIQSSSTDSVIRIHVSRKSNYLNITIWTSHPWLGDGLPQSELHLNQTVKPAIDSGWYEVEYDDTPSYELDTDPFDNSTNTGTNTLPSLQENVQPLRQENSRRSLGLALSHQLAEVHNGNISIQGSPESGYRYVISLPQLTEEKAFNPA
jgi:signal transduction histidine kinase